MLNADVNNKEIMNSIFETALAIKERIYGNRYVFHIAIVYSRHGMGLGTLVAVADLTDRIYLLVVNAYH